MFNFSKKRNTHRVFMDYASTTPIRDEVVHSMKPYLSEKFQNPSSIYLEGVDVKKDLEDSRTKVARILHVKSDDIFFTGSGTESDNISVLGVFEYFNQDESFKGVPHIITTNIEHPAILESCKEVERRGGKVTYVPVEENGIVNVQNIIDAVKEDTVLITVMYANNEIGTIQPLAKISRGVLKWKSNNDRSVGDFPYIHTDASQAPLYLDCNCERLGVDLMTLDGSKIYGPKGVSLLYKKHSVNIKPITFGGGQEMGLRPATENVSSIIGFTKAFELANEEREDVTLKITKLRDELIKNILDKVDGAELNGDRENRLANNVNVCIPGINAEFVVIKLDEKGIACASMTACKNLNDESESYVVDALGKGNCASSSLRFTLGKETTHADIEKVLGAIVSCI